MRCTMPGGLALLAFVGCLAAQDGSEVEAVQLTVRRKPAVEGVDVFGQPGLELQLAVRVPGKPILTVDGDKSRLVRFVDDAGTDLAKGAPTGFFSWVDLVSAFREQPTESALLQVKTETLPAKGAGRLELEAVVALISASGEQRKDASVTLKKGTKIEHGPVPMRVAEVEASSFGGSALSVQLASDAPLDAVKEVQFLGADGEPLEVQEQGSGSFGFGGKRTYTRSYGLPEALDAVTIRIVSWAKMETVELPVKLSIGVGLR